MKPPHSTESWGRIHPPSTRGDRSGRTLRRVDIPLAFRWVFVALVVLQLAALVPVLRRLRDPAPERRTGAGLDLLDAVGGVTALAGFTFGDFAVTLAGVACVGAALTAKGILRYRARERT